MAKNWSDFGRERIQGLPTLRKICGSAKSSTLSGTASFLASWAVFGRTLPPPHHRGLSEGACPREPRKIDR
jgi:hypothetical protein